MHPNTIIIANHDLFDVSTEEDMLRRASPLSSLAFISSISNPFTTSVFSSKDTSVSFRSPKSSNSLLSSLPNAPNHPFPPLLKGGNGGLPKEGKGGLGKGSKVELGEEGSGGLTEGGGDREVTGRPALLNCGT